MKKLALESLCLTASVAFWLVVLPAAALLSPFLLIFRRSGGPRPRRGRRLTRPHLLSIPAVAGGQ